MCNCVQCETDDKKRTLHDLRAVCSQRNGVVVGCARAVGENIKQAAPPTRKKLAQANKKRGALRKCQPTISISQSKERAEEM